MLPNKNGRVSQLMSELWMNEIQDNQSMDLWKECKEHYLDVRFFAALLEIDQLSAISR